METILPEQYVPKILILVGSAGVEPWKAIEEQGQERTFGQALPPNIRVLWVEANRQLETRLRFRLLDAFMRQRFEAFRVSYQTREVRPLLNFALSMASNFVVRAAMKRSARSAPIHIARRRVQLRLPPNYHLHPYRSLETIEFALRNYEFDFLLKITSTCYVDIERLLSLVADLPGTGVYGGEIYRKRKVSFVSGAATIFSRDVVEKIIENRKKMRLDVHDDVSLGELLARFGIAAPMFLPRCDAVGQSNAQLVELSRQPHGPYIYRCKTSPQTTDSSEPPIALMNKVHFLLQR